MGHEYTSLEIGLCHDIGQTSSMVDVEMADEQNVNGAEVEFVVERKRSKAFISWMHSGVQHHGLSLVLEDMAGATDFIAAAQADEGEVVRFILEDQISKGVGWISIRRRTITSSSTVVSSLRLVAMVKKCRGFAGVGGVGSFGARCHW